MFRIVLGAVVAAASCRRAPVAAIFCAAAYAPPAFARRRKIDVVRLLLFSLAPLVALLGGAVLFLVGRGF